jgi:dTDP-4-amino-4,6-dideoxygalactose transaminase
VQTPRLIPGAEHVYYQYCVYVSSPANASRRAIRRGVDFETTHVDVCSSLPLFKEFAADCVGAETTEQALQLPVYSRLRNSDVERVLRVMREVVGDFDSFDERSRPATTAGAVDVGGERQAKAS